MRPAPRLASIQRHRNFNPRTPREVRQAISDQPAIAIMISIHAPRERCDMPGIAAMRATCKISIHAPRERCDLGFAFGTASSLHFNPRTPREVRLKGGYFSADKMAFQSTHPARGATSDEGETASSIIFQSTHPARGATISDTAIL